MSFETIMEHLGSIGGFLWGTWTFVVLMAAGILFTFWTKFTQYRAMTHGIAVVRGVYDNPDDPGAINHFQALSAALSATVGLGNIGGVALAMAAGGPGALFWMWIIGFLGMALKTVEITLAMMYRNVDDPDNPHGGAMWVVDKVIASRGGVWFFFGKILAFFFCITLIISTFTGGNMFQSWSVADLTHTFWNVHPLVTGIILAFIVGLVIIGGIKRIGMVAGKIVPLMCLLYLVAALSVIIMNIAEIPSLLALVVKSAFSSTEAGGAFLGGSLGWAFSTGLRRALFSNEAGQGSAPIAHAAAKTGEPAREGIVGGIGPFIDTICICTLTALVILSTGAWDRKPLLTFDQPAVISPVFSFTDSPIADIGESSIGDDVYLQVALPTDGGSTPLPSPRLTGSIALNNEGDLVIAWNTYSAFSAPTAGTLEVMTPGELEEKDHAIGTIAAFPASKRAIDEGKKDDPTDDRPLWGLLSPPQPVEVPEDKSFLWNHLGAVFIVVEADKNNDTGFARHKLNGHATRDNQSIVTVLWGTLASAKQPKLVAETGLYRNYNGASLTAHAFDRQFAGLGKVLVPIAAWLFAISTMISWSYYGEQGMVYMLGKKSVLPYKLVYLAAVIFAAGWITDTGDMEVLIDLGTGAMLWANIPIVVCLGFLSVRSLNDYGRKLKAGEFPRHDAPKIEDVVSGRDVE